MTNGEKFLKDYYPNSTITRDSLTGRVFVNEDNADFTLPIEWWNAEYKEPTTKKDCNTCTHNNETDGSNCYECVKDMCNNYEPTTKNDLVHNLCDSCTNIGCEFQSGIVRTTCAFYMPPHLKPDNCGNYVIQEPTTKNDLGVECIDKAELLKAMDTWDKFGNDPNEGLIPLRTSALQDRYVPYVKYDDMVNCVKGMRSVTPQPRKGHWMLRNSFLVPYKCSECNYESERYDNYCPNCGADMREVEG